MSTQNSDTRARNIAADKERLRDLNTPGLTVSLDPLASQQYISDEEGISDDAFETALTDLVDADSE